MSNLAAQELQSFVRRIEALDDEIRALNTDKSEVFKEVKSAGFTAKTLRKVVAARRMDAAERDEADAEFELYWNAVHGIEIDHVRAHVENIEEFDADGVFIEPQPVSQAAQMHGNDKTGATSDVAATTSVAGQEGIEGQHLTGSSNGRTAEFDSANAGSTPAPVSNLTTFTPKPLRPYCLNAEKCGGQGRQHCWSCQKAHDEKQGAA